MRNRLLFTGREGFHLKDRRRSTSSIIERGKVRAWKTLAVIGAIACAMISGTATAAPISQAEWARLLVEAMGIEDGIAPAGAASSDFIEFLSGDPPATVRVEAVSARPWPQRARKERDPGPPETSWLRAGSSSATPGYRVLIPRGGIYALRYRGKGRVQRWRMDAKDVRIGNPGKETTSTPSGLPSLLGYFILSRGEHAVTVDIPPEGGLQAFELVRQPFPHIRPPGGWKPDVTLTYGAKAVTLVQAMQIEQELPALRRFRVQREGERFDAEIRPAIQTNAQAPGKPSSGAWVLGRPEGSWLVYDFDVERWGTYSLLARVTGNGNGRLLLDDRVFRAWGAPGSQERFVWRKVSTLPLTAGRHRMDVYLEEDAGFDVLRLLFRDPAPEASLMLLRDLGFEEGAPDDPVSFSAAKENLANPIFRERLESLGSSFFTQPGPGVGPGSGPLLPDFPELQLPEPPLPEISPE
jgi:hypothetical protein